MGPPTHNRRLHGPVRRNDFGETERTRRLPAIAVACRLRRRQPVVLDVDGRNWQPRLRPYILVQFYPLLAILLLLWMFEPRYTRGYDFLIALAFYVAAKMFEVADKPVYAATGNVISGHTLKHLSAGVGGYWLARMLANREHLREITIAPNDKVAALSTRSN